MEIEVREEKENPFFGRKELKVEVRHFKAATPSKQELRKELSSKYSVPEENIVIDYIFTKKGLSESLAKVKIYREKPEEKKGEGKVEAQAGEAK